MLHGNFSLSYWLLSCMSGLPDMIDPKVGHLSTIFVPGNENLTNKRTQYQMPRGLTRTWERGRCRSFKTGKKKITIMLTPISAFFYTFLEIPWLVVD